MIVKKKKLIKINFSRQKLEHTLRNQLIYEFFECFFFFITTTVKKFERPLVLWEICGLTFLRSVDLPQTNPQGNRIEERRRGVKYNCWVRSVMNINEIV